MVETARITGVARGEGGGVGVLGGDIGGVGLAGGDCGRVGVIGGDGVGVGVGTHAESRIADMITSLKCPIAVYLLRQHDHLRFQFDNSRPEHRDLIIPVRYRPLQ